MFWGLISDLDSSGRFKWRDIDPRLRTSRLRLLSGPGGSLAVCVKKLYTLVLSRWVSSVSCHTINACSLESTVLAVSRCENSPVSRVRCRAKEFQPSSTSNIPQTRIPPHSLERSATPANSLPLTPLGKSKISANAGDTPAGMSLFSYDSFDMINTPILPSSPISQSTPHTQHSRHHQLWGIRLTSDPISSATLQHHTGNIDASCI